jgi:hypothetical protein
MQLSEWSKSEIDYGRRVLDSGLEGVRSGREAFLNGRPLNPFFRESFRRALTPATVGACLGVLSACPGNGNRSVGRTLTSGVLGACVGLAAGLLWETRFLTASSAGAALEGMEKVRDEHWFERHPIDYA